VGATWDHSRHLAIASRGPARVLFLRMSVLIYPDTTMKFLPATSMP